MRDFDENNITEAVIERFGKTPSPRLKEIMVNSFNDVVGFSQKFQVNTRLAAYMLAIDRVAYDTRLRGIYA